MTGGNGFLAPFESWRASVRQEGVSNLPRIASGAFAGDLSRGSEENSRKFCAPLVDEVETPLPFRETSGDLLMQL